MPHRSEIQIRDPFVVPVPEENAYYLYGTTDKNAWSGKATGFDAYRSKDLEHWEGPFPVFRPAAGFWADENFWAPEVHRYGGRYYMFASFKAEGRRRATQILTADRPLGPFAPICDRAATPDEWECLDGTLYTDRSGAPWIVYCREWLQTVDGEMYAQRLEADLSAPLGAPIRLFSATEAQWVRETGHGGHRGFVTDGPFLFRPENGRLWMLWSSHGPEGYAIGLAKSASGEIEGPWEQEEEPFFRKDGGHGMLFETFEGWRMLAIHCPNVTPHERPVFFRVAERDGSLMLEPDGQA